MSEHCHHHETRPRVSARLAASATVHCLVGCSIGEVIGLMLAVSLGWPVWLTITVATVLAFISGFALTLIPMMKSGRGFVETFRIVWLGETISIGVMEVAMNATDYAMGGMQVASIAVPLFWLSMGVAMVAGFVAAFPVNWWMLRRNIKEKCH